MQQIQSKFGDKLPLVIAGDFNDTPKSAVYQLLATGTEQNGLSHSFKLKSSYTNYDNTNAEPWTTYKERSTVVLRTIDYIWYSTEHLRVTKLLEIPDYQVFTNKLPCDVYPGDHLAIMSEFEFE